MGIRGLTTMVNNNAHLFMEDHKLHSTKLIIDGDGLCPHLIFNDPDKSTDRSTHLGEPQYFYNLYKKFFQKLLACKIDCRIIFDGGIESDGKKNDTLKQRHQHAIDGIKRLIDGEDSDTIYSAQVSSTSFVWVIHDLGIFNICSNSEADRDIAVIANYLKCPVLGNDSDFMVMNIKHGYIPLDSLNLSAFDQSFYTSASGDDESTQMEYIPCKRYHIDWFCDYFYISPDVMPVFATLSGNDYVKGLDLGTFFSFVKESNQRKYERNLHPYRRSARRFGRILHHLTYFDNQVDCLDVVLKTVPQSERPKIIASCDMYDVTKPSPLIKYKSSDGSSNHGNEESGSSKHGEEMKETRASPEDQQEGAESSSDSKNEKVCDIFVPQWMLADHESSKHLEDIAKPSYLPNEESTNNGSGSNESSADQVKGDHTKETPEDTKEGGTASSVNASEDSDLSEDESEFALNRIVFMSTRVEDFSQPSSRFCTYKLYSIYFGFELVDAANKLAVGDPPLTVDVYDRDGPVAKCYKLEPVYSVPGFGAVPTQKERLDMTEERSRSFLLAAIDGTDLKLGTVPEAFHLTLIATVYCIRNANPLIPGNIIRALVLAWMQGIAWNKQRLSHVKKKDGEETTSATSVLEWDDNEVCKILSNFEPFAYKCLQSGLNLSANHALAQWLACRQVAIELDGYFGVFHTLTSAILFNGILIHNLYFKLNEVQSDRQTMWIENELFSGTPNALSLFQKMVSFLTPYIDEGCVEGSNEVMVTKSHEGNYGDQMSSVVSERDTHEVPRDGSWELVHNKRGDRVNRGPSARGTRHGLDNSRANHGHGNWRGPNNDNRGRGYTEYGSHRGQAGTSYYNYHRGTERSQYGFDDRPDSSWCSSSNRHSGTHGGFGSARSIERRPHCVTGFHNQETQGSIQKSGNRGYGTFHRSNIDTQQDRDDRWQCSYNRGRRPAGQREQRGGATGHSERSGRNGVRGVNQRRGRGGSNVTVEKPMEEHKSNFVKLQRKASEKGITKRERRESEN